MARELSLGKDCFEKSQQRDLEPDEQSKVVTWFVAALYHLV